VRWLSPFDHLPLVPAEDPSLAASAAVLGVALAVGAAGQLAFRRRDIG
jgi:ABC-2 type transport system permease protein